MATHGLFDDALSCLELNRGIQILGHFLACDADESRIKFEAEVWLESDVDFLLGLGIHDALMVVKLEAVVEDLLHLSALFATLGA